MTNAAKSVLVGYTFLQKPSSSKFLSILEENCGADIINGTFKCKTFADKCCKKSLLSALGAVKKMTSGIVSKNRLERGGSDLWVKNCASFFYSGFLYYGENDIFSFPP